MKIEKVESNKEIENFIEEEHQKYEAKNGVVCNYTPFCFIAKENDELIGAMDLYADWCVPCRIMEANVYSDPTVASLLNTRFYSVKLNADSQDTIMCDGQKKTVQRCYFDVWELSALPAFVLIAPKGLSILTVTDSMSPQELQLMLYQFLEKEKEWIER